MDSGGGIEIEKLNNTNYQLWKQKTELVLTYREAEKIVQKENPQAKKVKNT